MNSFRDLLQSIKKAGLCGFYSVLLTVIAASVCWGTYPESFPAADKQWLQERGKIIYAVYAGEMPEAAPIKKAYELELNLFAHRIANEIPGFVMEFEVYGVRSEFEQAIKSKVIDAVIGLPEDDARDLGLKIGDPILTLTPVVYAHASRIKTIKEIDASKVLAISRHISALRDIATKYAPHVAIAVTDNTWSAYEMLDRGVADAAIGFDHSYLLKHTTQDDIVPISRLENDAIDFFIAAVGDDPELRRISDSLLRWAGLGANNYVLHMQENGVVGEEEVNPGHWSQEKVLYVGVNDCRPFMGFPEGKVKNIVPKLMDTLGHLTGYDFRYVPYGQCQAQTNQTSRSVDIIVDADISEGPPVGYSLVGPLASIPQVFVNQQGEGFIPDFKHLKGNVVAAVSESTAYKMIQDHPDRDSLQLVGFDTAESAINAVIDKTADVFAGNLYTVSYFLADVNYSEKLKFATPLPVAFGSLTLWADTGNLEVVNALTEAISEIPAVQMQDILNDWLVDTGVIYREGDPKEGPLLGISLLIIILLFLVSAIIIFWNSRLKTVIKKQSDEAVIRENEYRSFFDNAQAGLIVEDAATQGIIDCNAKAAEILGYDNRSEMLEKSNDAQHIPNESRRKIYERIFEHKSVVNAGTELIKYATGDRVWVRMHSRLTDEGDRIYHVIIDDSRKRKAEQTLKNYFTDLEKIIRERTEELEESLAETTQAKKEAENANKAKSAFLSNASHELRTPLTAILGYAQALIADNGLSEENREKADIINRSGKRLLALINDILEISKVEAGEAFLDVRPTSFMYIIEEVKRGFEHELRQKNISFKIEMSHDFPPQIVCDAERIRQILANLMGCSIRLTEDGFIRVNATYTYPSETDQAGELNISVFDSGVGLSPEEVSALQKPFSMGRHGRLMQLGGTGVGFAVAKRFAQFMGGDISVGSTEGYGSLYTFTCAMGFSNEGAPLPAEAPTLVEVERKTLEGVNILVADDAEPTRAIIRDTLAAVGKASEGSLSVKQILQTEPPVQYEAPLTSEELEQVPPDDRDRLLDALLDLSPQKIRNIIQEIEDSHPAVGQKMSRLTKSYNYDLLIEMLKEQSEGIDE